MDISSLLQAILDPQLNRSAWVQKVIKPGDVFRLKVIDVKDNHRALVDLGKFRALAEIKFPVKAGADLLVTACPECKMMLDAAVDETVDLAELVAASMKS